MKALIAEQIQSTLQKAKESVAMLICRQLAKINGKIVEISLKTKKSHRTVSIGEDAVGF